MYATAVLCKPSKMPALDELDTAAASTHLEVMFLVGLYCYKFIVTTFI